MSETEDIQNLTVGDRLNLPYILANEWMKLNSAMVKQEGQQSDQERTEAVLSFESSIPNIFKDDLYWEERKKAVETINVDNRIVWCGLRIGKPIFIKKIQIDPFILKQTIVNLLQRNGYLSKIIYTEKIVPAPEDFENAEIKTTNNEVRK